MSKPQRILLGTAQAAEVLNVSVRTLQYWRERGIGPPYYQLGAWPKYDQAELEKWLAAQRREGRAA